MGSESPPMGYGNFHANDFVHACYLRYAAFQNESKFRKDYGPEDDRAATVTDKPDYCGVEYYGDQGGEVGYSLQLGGGGGRCDN